MAVNFPDSPTNGDTTVINGATYTWDGVKWDTTSFASNVTATYDSPLNLPTTGLTNGDVAWVGGSTNKLYISNGTGWLSATLTNSAPVINSVQDASAGTTPFSLATDGTPTVITVDATDPESFGLTYTYAVTGGALGTTATVSQADNVFTITPGTSDPADAGTFELTFSVYDGVNTVTSVANFTLAFIGDWWGDRGITFGSTSVAPYDQVDYFDISTQSSASNFGSLGLNADPTAAVSNSARVVSNVGYYLSPATLGSATSGSPGFAHNCAGTGDGIIGIFFGGVAYGQGQIDVINIDTLAATVNVAEYSDIFIGTNYTNGYNGAGSNGTSAVYHTGNSGVYENRLEYVTIANLSNGTYFGDLSRPTHLCKAAEDMTYIVFGSNWDTSTNTTGTSLDKVTTDTAGNATFFGSLSSARQGPSGTTNGTYAVFSGAYTSSTMDYFIIQTGGSAVSTASLSWNSDRASSSGSPS